MERTGTFVLRRLAGAVVLAVVTAAAVMVMASMIGAGPAGNARYVVPHQHEQQHEGADVTGTITDPRR